MAVLRKETQIVELVLPLQGTGSHNCINHRDNWRDLETRLSYFSDEFPHTQVWKATALHYACMTRDMMVVEMLLKAGADWTLEDSRDRKPDAYLFDGDDGDMKAAFKRLCEEEEERRKERKEAPTDGGIGEQTSNRKMPKHGGRRFGYYYDEGDDDTSSENSNESNDGSSPRPCRGTCDPSFPCGFCSTNILLETLPLSNRSLEPR